MFLCNDKAYILHVIIWNERGKFTRKFYLNKKIYSCLNKIVTKLLAA